MKLRILKKEWLPAVTFDRIIVHWTAGAYAVSGVDRKAYHFIVDGDGKVHVGVNPALNSGKLKPGYAAHTLNLNTNSLSVSLACMASAVESPFNAGRFPMKEIQYDTLILILADLAEFYKIPIHFQSILSHAEVQGNLGVTQRGKWDYTRLAFAPQIVGGRKIGDLLRKDVTAMILLPPSLVPAPVIQPSQPAPIPAGGTARVKTNGGNLAVRRGPGLTEQPIGNGFPNGLLVEVIRPSEDGLWALVEAKTPTATSGWVSAQWIEMIDGPSNETPTTPDPKRVILTEIREKLIEAALQLEKLLD